MNGRPNGRSNAYAARRPTARRRQPERGLAVALPVFVFSIMAIIALFGLVGSVAVFAFYSQDLPDPHGLQSLGAVGKSIVYDRTGTVQLATFGANEARQPVTWDQIPPILTDAQTAIEDKSFWSNAGVDPIGILSATIATLQGNERGASTITQQLVRERLLDPNLVSDPGRVIERKLKEIIQSVRVTEAYPGEQGKQQIITAYFNANYYGNGSYGVLAAAKGYFGVTDLSQLSLGEVALLAALPQSPSTYDLVRNAVTAPDGHLYVPLDPTIPIVARRDYILDLLASDPSRLVLTGNEYTPADFEAAKNEPINLAPQASTQQQWLAPHFIWALRDELAQKLCGDADTCPTLEAGGLRITSTLDWHMQQIAEKWVTAGVFLPHSTDPQAMAAELGVPYESWMKKLAKLQVGNGALVAMDYQTGEVLAYVGSAGYYRASDATPQFQPQFDVLANGWRQSGSAFKPFNFVTGINDGTMTAASMFMDVTTAFPDGSNTYIPTDYDQLERGPLRMRSALQWSLNIPAVKALAINGVNHVFDMARRFGMNFQNDQPSAGLSLTLGTEETHPIDVTEAYATLANNGRNIGYTHILSIKDASGTDVVPPYSPPAGEQVVSPQAAYVMTNILASNTDPQQNPVWGAFALRGPGGRRPATIKTGTNDNAVDLDAFGYIAPPDDAGRAAGDYALVVGVWNGNSDGSSVLRPDNPVFSTDIAAPTWHGFMQEVTQDWPGQDFAQPPGIVTADVDAWTGMAPTSVHDQDRAGGVHRRHGARCRHHQRAVAGGDRRVGQHPAVGRRLRGHATDGGFPEPGQRRGRASRLAGGGPGVDRARQAGHRHSRRRGPAEPDQDQLPVQPRLHAVRQELGRTVAADDAMHRRAVAVTQRIAQRVAERVAQPAADEITDHRADPGADADGRTHTDPDARDHADRTAHPHACAPDADLAPAHAHPAADRTTAVTNRKPLAAATFLASSYRRAATASASRMTRRTLPPASRARSRSLQPRSMSSANRFG